MHPCCGCSSAVPNRALSITMGKSDCRVHLAKWQGQRSVTPTGKYRGIKWRSPDPRLEWVARIGGVSRIDRKRGIPWEPSLSLVPTGLRIITNRWPPRGRHGMGTTTSHCSNQYDAGGRTGGGGGVGQHAAGTEQLELDVEPQRCRHPTSGIKTVKAHSARKNRFVNIVRSLYQRSIRGVPGIWPRSHGRHDRHTQHCTLDRIFYSRNQRMGRITQSFPDI